MTRGGGARGAILVLAAATLAAGSGCQLPLIVIAVFVWRPAVVATAMIVILTRAPLASVPSRQRIGGPVWQLPRVVWIDTTLFGSRRASITRTSDAASGPAFLTVIV